MEESCDADTMQCPHCGDTVARGEAMARHMQEEHPEVLRKLMEESMRALGALMNE